MALPGCADSVGFFFSSSLVHQATMMYGMMHTSRSHNGREYMLWGCLMLDRTCFLCLLCT
uniref:Uncharacterized protein n=1 Tax=Arundo donax TaxID=35708 RepID=A0A0A9B0J1_ARUDO